MYISQKKEFTDFGISHWAFKYVHYLTGEGSYVDENGNETESVHVIDGFEDNTFRPDENVTRVQLLKMAIAAFGDYTYYKEANANGGYPNGYIKTAADYGFSDGVDMKDINANATRGEAAKIISNTINIPLQAVLQCDLISDDHKIIPNTVLADFSGANKHFDYKTFKTVLVNKDNSMGIAAKTSPIDEGNGFYAYGTVDSVSGDKITVSLTTLTNTDGSIYDYNNTLTVVNGGFEFEKGGYYYFKFKQQDNKWTVDNYAVK